jgi:hypothetical protein
MKNSKNSQLVSSTLKTVASENLVSEDELIHAKDKPLEEVLNANKQEEDQQNITEPQSN